MCLILHLESMQQLRVHAWSGMLRVPCMDPGAEGRGGECWRCLPYHHWMSLPRSVPWNFHEQEDEERQPWREG
ncbi:Os09g0270601 [Oryza sativa Japonica Group]|uniref:Os09g0270601 protein n=1 Tax=Oryza sativa subsp. japonica TaxID=39947 RepID=A0A0P0XLK1_ORYSJ|nr:Os09g0270601 [Oryza sativa Japonica Group]